VVYKQLTKELDKFPERQRYVTVLRCSTATNITRIRTVNQTGIQTSPLL